MKGANAVEIVDIVDGTIDPRSAADIVFTRK
jgi:hypothetical protein